MDEPTRFRDLITYVLMLGLAGCPEPSNRDGGVTDVADTLVNVDTSIGCMTDRDCDDRVFCNGVERCMHGVPSADARGCVVASPSNPCATGQMCNESMMRCLTMCDIDGDADGDGHRAMSCNGDDCDDADARRFPGNTEVCDTAGHDEDCNACTVGSATSGDDDHDTFVSTTCRNAYEGTAPGCDPTGTRVDAAMRVVTGADCNDGNMDIRPSQTEACNGFDDNCNGMIDESVAIHSYYPDCDGDGFGADVTAVSNCARPAMPPAACATGAWVELRTDCDDAVAQVHPGVTERCNGVDDDCDGTVDGSAAAPSCVVTMNAVSMACVASQCAVASCTMPFGDCDHLVTNGCEASLTTSSNCGACGNACSTGYSCQPRASDGVYRCVPAPCMPLNCAAIGADCGENGDGCGGSMNCGSCDMSTQMCIGAPGRCQVATSCTRRSCMDANANCGSVADGCGGLLECGTCGPNEECGAGGMANRCVVIPP